MKTPDEFGERLTEYRIACVDSELGSGGEIPSFVHSELLDAYADLAAVLHAVDRGWLFVSCCGQRKWYYATTDEPRFPTEISTSLLTIPPEVIADIKKRMEVPRG